MRRWGLFFAAVAVLFTLKVLLDNPVVNPLPSVLPASAPTGGAISAVPPTTGVPRQPKKSKAKDAEYFLCDRRDLKVVFGVLAGPDYIHTRIVTALKTWLRDEVSVLYLEREDDPKVQASITEHLTGPSAEVRNVKFSIAFLAQNAVERKINEPNGAWKNLPILADLWKRHPEADWFVTVDDDSFVIQDNLRILLSSTYAPRDWASQYCASDRGVKLSEAGSAPRPALGSKYFGCGMTTTVPTADDPEKKLTVTFGHGGGGFAFSRDAMQKIGEGMDLCNKHCTVAAGGDYRAGCCAVKHGIEFTDDCHFTMFSYFRAFHYQPRNHYRLNKPYPVSFHYHRKNMNATYDLHNVAAQLQQDGGKCEASVSQRNTKHCEYLRSHGASAIAPLFWDSLLKEYATEPYISRYPKDQYLNDNRLT